MDLLSAWTIVAALVAAAGMHEWRAIRRKRRRRAVPHSGEDQPSGVEQT
jgi:hypothetical protein